MKISLLSVIVPIYKKEKTIRADLTKIYTTLKNTPYNFEIIAVVDGTNLDNSYSEAKKLNLPNLRVYGYKFNNGKGQAVRYGMQLARGEVVSFLDSGGDIDPQGIEMLLLHMEWYNADVIIGSKLHSASQVDNYTTFRRLLTYGYYLFVKMLFRMRIRDTQTGLKIFKKEVLENVLDKLVIKRFAFDIELLVVANKLGYTKIYDAPVKIDFKAAESNVLSASFFTNILAFVSDTLSVWYRMYILNYYDSSSQREKLFDINLNMWVNTGNMIDGRKQIVINLVNGLYSFLKGLVKNNNNLNDLDMTKDKTNQPFVSVVIPTQHIGYFLLFETLPALDKQTYKNFEVIVLPDQRDPYDAKLLSMYPWLKIKSTLDVTRPSEKRDMGVAESKGDIIAFLDSDAYPSPDWLQNAVVQFNETGADAITGPGVLPENTLDWEKAFDEVFKNPFGSGGYKYRFYPQDARYVDDYPSMNFIIKKKVFEKLGGFSDYYPGEDSKLCEALVNDLNGTIYYHPSVLVYHHRRMEFKPYLKQHMKYGNHRGAFFGHGDANSKRLSYLIPSLFLLYLVSIPFVEMYIGRNAYLQSVSILGLSLSALYLVPLLGYLWGVFFQIVNSLLNTNSIKIMLMSVFTLVSTHLAYGFAFIQGYLNKDKYLTKSAS